MPLTKSKQTHLWVGAFLTLLSVLLVISFHSWHQNNNQQSVHFLKNRGVQLDLERTAAPSSSDLLAHSNPTKTTEPQLSAEEKTNLEAIVSAAAADLQAIEKSNVIPLTDHIDEGTQRLAIAVACPDESQIRGIRVKAGSLSDNLGLSEKGGWELHMRLGKLIKDYCDYPKPYKIIELCSPSSTATNLIEYYSDTPTLKQRNENGFLILEDSQRSRGDDKWGKPHSWSQVRYQHLFEIDTLESK